MDLRAPKGASAPAYFAYGPLGCQGDRLVLAALRSLDRRRLTDMVTDDVQNCVPPRAVRHLRRLTLIAGCLIGLAGCGASDAVQDAERQANEARRRAEQAAKEAEKAAGSGRVKAREAERRARQEAERARERLRKAREDAGY